MASDSGSSYTVTYSQGASPNPRLPVALPSQRPMKASMGGMLLLASNKKKASIKAEMSGIMKRAASSPNFRDLTNIDTSTLSSAEKKRNKLGYHRTAVACVHCRRRKIRCILAMDESTTRCQNCIRLKKDCQYYPVDQQPPPSKKTRQSSKTDEAGSGSPTPETSPEMASASWDPSESYRSGQFHLSNVSPDGAGHYPFRGPILQSENTALSNTTYTPVNIYSQSGWNSAPVLASTMQPMETGQFNPSQGTHWQARAQHAPGSYEIPSYPSSAIQTPLHSATQEHFPQFATPHAPEPHMISQMPYHPARSMSLANTADLQHYQSPYHNEAPIYIPRHASVAVCETQIPSVPSNANPTPPGSDSHSTSSAYTFADPHSQLSASFHSGAPLQSPSIISVSGPEAYAGLWYNPSGSLAGVKEEEEMAHMHHQQLMSGRLM